MSVSIGLGLLCGYLWKEGGKGRERERERERELTVLQEKLGMSIN